MPEIRLPNFSPRPYQRRFMRYMDDGGKRAIKVWHRRSGKDLTDAHQTCVEAHARRGNYWHMFPTGAMGRKMLWENKTREGERTLEQVFPGFLDPKRRGSIVRATNQTEMSIELKCGSMWRLIGSDKTENVGGGPAGVVISEYALCKPTVWDFLRPILRENDGWAVFNTTPRGKNHAWKVYQDAKRPGSGWYHSHLSVFQTGLQYASERQLGRLLSPAELLEEERASGMEEALVRQEYLCDWSAANVGSIWGDLLEQLERAGGMEDFEHERDGIHTAWDLGLSDSTAIWFFRYGRDEEGQRTIDVVDWYEDHGRPISHYLDELEIRSVKHGWKYLRHWVPHDARAQTLQTGQSTLEIMRDWLKERRGYGQIDVSPQLSIPDGIQAGRWVLGGSQYRVRFHPRVAEGVEALKQYQYEYDPERKTFSRTPLHDWSSHTADAFRYLSVVARVAAKVKEPPKKLDLPIAVSIDRSFRLDELWRQRAREQGKRRGRY